MTLMPEVRDARHASGRLWSLAAVCAVAVHAAVALTLASVQSDSSEESFGAAALEVGLETGAPSEDASDLPPGPEMAASVASAAAAEQTPVVDEAAPVRIDRAPSATADPAAMPDAAEQPKPDDPDKAAVRRTASQDSAAAEAIAPPSQEAVRPAPRSVAPAPGNEAGDRRLRVVWQNALRTHVEKYKRYPAARSQKTVDLIVRFSIDRAGHVLSAEILKSSGDAEFDAAAIAMLRRADPVPLPPPTVADQGLSFNLPVSFRVGS
ncbi:MAG: TonB family protein [Xanthobacteraceae bacterium]|nr:TonB family protein [Xanthobacteraceae bacterium]